MSELRAVLAPYVDDVERELRRLIPQTQGPFSALHGMLRYHLGWVNASFEVENVPSGKRVRPALCLMAADAVSGDWDVSLPAAAAIELLHEFSLIHDDIEDRDHERRHRRTVWAIWGEAQGINAGDALFALSQIALTGVERNSVPAETIVDAQRRFNLTALRLCQGQHLDLDFETRDTVTPSEYLTMIGGKTVSLLALAPELGALVAGGTREQVAACHEFGRQLGIAFQIQDDILGLWGDEHQTGKPVGNDIRQKKKTLPILFALNQDSEQAERLRDLYSRETLTEADITEARRLIDAIGARDDAERQMHDAYDAATAALDRLQATSTAELVEPMRTLVRALIQRNA